MAEQREKIERYAKEVRSLDPQVLTDHLDSAQKTIATLESTPRANDEYKYKKESLGPRRWSVTSKVERQSNVTRRMRERPLEVGGEKVHRGRRPGTEPVMAIRTVHDAQKMIPITLTIFFDWVHAKKMQWILPYLKNIKFSCGFPMD